MLFRSGRVDGFEEKRGCALTASRFSAGAPRPPPRVARERLVLPLFLRRVPVLLPALPLRSPTPPSPLPLSTFSPFSRWREPMITSSLLRAHRSARPGPCSPVPPKIAIFTFSFLLKNVYLILTYRPRNILWRYSENLRYRERGSSLARLCSQHEDHHFAFLESREIIRRTNMG